MRTHAHRPRQLTRSTDCVKFVATREFLITLPSMEPLAVARQQGVRIKNFYTAYQIPGCAIAVPADSPIHKLTDLKGKTIGVTNMASAGVIIARALAAASGLNPDTDINLVVAGEGAQPAALLRSKQVDALASSTSARSSGFLPMASSRWKTRSTRAPGS
jgi:NitT/TauT family transport system substrate-binding protein